MSLTLKIVLGSDIRRISLPERPSIDKLEVVIRNLFQIELGNKNFTIKYKDEDGDLITISHDTGLVEAWREASNRKPSILRLIVTPGTEITRPRVAKKPVPKKKVAAKKTKKPAKKTKKSKKSKKSKKAKKQKATKKCALEKKCDEISKTLLKLVNKALSHPEVIKILNKFNINPVIVRAQVMLIAPFLKIEYLKPFLKVENLIAVAKFVLNYFDFKEVDVDSCTDYFKNFNLDCCKKYLQDACDFDFCDEIVALLDDFGMSDFGFCKNFCKKDSCNKGEEEEEEEKKIPTPKKVPRKPRAARRRAPIEAVVDSKLLCDVTIEDGFEVNPSAEFLKIWSISNTGNCAWPEGTKLVNIGGSTLATVDSVEVPSIEPGDKVEISVDMVAPRTAGRYISTFRLQEPDGSYFGHRVWCDIVVVEPEDDEEVIIETVDEDEEGEEVAVDTKVVKASEEEEKEEGETILDAAVQGVLDQLQAMGFIDREQNLKYIELYGTSDIMSIVNRLLA